MKLDPEITAAVFQLTLLKKAQLQEQMALKLIESATSSSQVAKSEAAQMVVTHTAEDQPSEHTIDIRV